MSKEISFADAIREATVQAMKEDPSVILIGEGVPDPKAVFGTTAGLQEIFGHDRVFDMPVSENGGTGICIGAAISGMKPIIVHQRIDFALYAMDQIVNNAAKWHSMFGGQAGRVPMVIRCIIGRGWGQGNQHSQNLTGLFATIPGLKVVCPSNPVNVKGLFLSAVQDPNPVMFIEHRWLHSSKAFVPEVAEPIPLGKADLLREGPNLTIVAWSYMTIEALRAWELLNEVGIKCDVIDLRTVRPLDFDLIKSSLIKTKRLLVLDESWEFNSLAGEIIAKVAEDRDINLIHRPKRITSKDCYAPSTPGLTSNFYPRSSAIVKAAIEMCPSGGAWGRKNVETALEGIKRYEANHPHDVPDVNFMGPF